MGPQILTFHRFLLDKNAGAYKKRNDSNIKRSIKSLIEYYKKKI